MDDGLVDGMGLGDSLDGVGAGLMDDGLVDGLVGPHGAGDGDLGVDGHIVHETRTHTVQAVTQAHAVATPVAVAHTAPVAVAHHAAAPVAAVRAAAPLVHSAGHLAPAVFGAHY